MSTIKVAGSTLVVDDGTGTNTDITIGEVHNMSFDGGSVPENDVTNFASTAQEFRPGLPDYGSVTIDLRLDPDDNGQDELDDIRTNQETREFKLTFPEGTDKVITFSGYVNSFGFDADVQGIAQGSVAVRLTGALTKSTS